MKISYYFCSLLMLVAVARGQSIDLQAELLKSNPLTRLVLVPAGMHSLSQSLIVPSNISVVCTADTVILAAPGAFKDAGDVPAASLVVLSQVENVQFFGCSFRMQGSAYYRDPANGYEKSEFRHSVRVTGSKNITFSDCRFELSGGDGLYVGPEVLPTGRIPCVNVRAQRCKFSTNHRQGLSVVAGSATVEDSLFNGTQGTSPQAGFDAEPATVLDFVDVTVRRSHSEKNRGPAWMIGLFASNPNSPPSRILLEDCTYADVRPDQPWMRWGGLISDEFVEGVTAKGLPHKNLPKGTFVQVNGVVVIDKR